MFWHKYILDQMLALKVKVKAKVEVTTKVKKSQLAFLVSEKNKPTWWWVWAKQHHFIG